MDQHHKMSGFPWEFSTNFPRIFHEFSTNFPRIFLEFSPRIFHDCSMLPLFYDSSTIDCATMEKSWKNHGKNMAKSAKSWQNHGKWHNISWRSDFSMIFL